MSEQANVQLIQAAYAAFKRGDIQTILDSLSEGVKWVAADVAPVAGTYHGRNEVAGFFRKVNETAEYLSFEPREFVAQGDRVVVLGSYRAKVKATGRFYDCDWAMAFLVEHGKVTEFREYTDTAAIAAALAATSAAGA
jgi:ketosteroid isomerase-like protein